MIVLGEARASLIRLEATTGMPTSGRSLAVTRVKAPRGTDVTIVGTRASCQPIPVLMIVAPAASTSWARATTSSQLCPSGTRSVIERRKTMMKSVPTAARTAPDDLDGEAPPRLGRAPVAVGALVGARREELVEQVALGRHDLDAVVTRLTGPGARTGRMPLSSARSRARSARGPGRGRSGDFVLDARDG